MSTQLALADLGIPDVARSALPGEQAERLAATLDAERAPGDGEALPLLWHWAFFTPTEPTSALGHDGHPRRSDHPLIEGLPRRMFAGGRVRQLQPLVAGEPAERHARLIGADRKVGRSGRLLIVTVAYDVLQRGRIAVEEQQSLVYREAGAPLERPAGDMEPTVPDGGWCDRATMDEAALFRFSAVTFNAHRIHYDGDYARSVEGYPELVVHGPLIALLLAGAARRRIGPITSFTFRATAPLFRGLPFFLVGAPGAGEAALTAVRNDGHEAMRATAVPTTT